MNTLILFGVRKNCMTSGRNPLFCQFARRAIKLTVVIIVGYHCYQTLYKNYPIYSSLSVTAIRGKNYKGHQFGIWHKRSGSIFLRHWREILIAPAL
jgi:hypothetical protein